MRRSYAWARADGQVGVAVQDRVAVPDKGCVEHFEVFSRRNDLRAPYREARERFVG